MVAPLVSIVVPFHNSARYASRTLVSLLAQNAPGVTHEIIAVDNLSIDDTVSKLTAFEPRIRVVRSSRKGAGAARNDGVECATGRYIAFMDGDCIADPDWLAAFVKAMQEEPDTVILGGPIVPVDETNAISAFSRNLYDQEAAVTSERFPYAVTCNMFLARSMFIDTKGFDEALLRGQDVDFSWRAASDCAAHFRFVADARVFHENPSTFAGLFAKGLQHGKGMAYLSIRHGNATGLTLSRRVRDLRPWRRILGEFNAYLFGGRGSENNARQPRNFHLYWAVFNLAKQLSCVFHSARYLLRGE